jgi:hypothetical protein
MKLLDAVNLMLPKLGEHPVTSLTVRHPTLAIILPEVENELKTTLLKGWWFNQYDYTAMPDSQGFITLGSDCLSFVPDRVDAAVRGVRLFNPTTLDYVWTASVKGRITQNVAFEDLPESAAQYVWYNALCSVFVTDIGMANDVQTWMSRASAAYSMLHTEHLRNKKYTTMKSVRFQRLRCAMRA